ncbi:permease [Lutimaribacter sp. EGI FJ00015]|uniref:Permease n=1 Tax=Lutimaribacter degradans TaxID=2945989 RepID=A0ACC5ZSN1_9RHOB|nr:permease [Lutimaribacter sp. EGI FJ00013]MCM2561046.1 permease [Lutimaribacter sp. EGI FJ00013]MCO0612006.1 permease [Lutimaribacter sp. EGI FJ00015]MCO0634874.1 permease [Lutimaribacter sp. EGI FJ00014]
MTFVNLWADAALTSAGFFWMAFWAFGLGYVISAAIQTFVGRAQMRAAMGDSQARGVALGTVFGFISSSCSFSALAGTRAIFAKGAGFVPSMAFLLASTNLVIELGIVISVFLSWHFVVAEYVGGVVLILVMWLVVRLTRPGRLITKVRERLEAGDEDEPLSVSSLLGDLRSWEILARGYLGEWHMVWKDVTVGFATAGIIAAFVPPAFFTWLFPGTGSEDLATWQVISHAFIGPVAAFFTFIGSMGNIPLAGLLFANGVSVAGIMAFIFSDLVVFPVIRVHAQYYGWKMALYIAFVFLVALVLTALAVHYAFGLAGLVPEPSDASLMAPGERFVIDYTFWLNLAFGAVTVLFGWLAWRARGHGGHAHDHSHGGLLDTVLYWLALLAWGWLLIGLALNLVV